MTVGRAVRLNVWPLSWKSRHTPPPRPQLGHVPGDNRRGGVRPGRNFELSLLVRAAHVHTSDHDTLYN